MPAAPSGSGGKLRKQMLNIIYILNGDWETDHRRPQMEAMTKNCNLICIEKPLTLTALFNNPRTFFKQLKKSLEPKYSGENLQIFKPLALLPYSVTEKLLGLRIINRLILRNFVRQKIQPHIKNSHVLILAHPMQRHFIGLLNTELLCYEITDAYDKITGFSDRKNRMIRELERAVLSEADIVFTSAMTLQKEKRRYNENTFFIPNGADVDLFSRSLSPDISVPEELAKIPSPRIGLIGHITANVDLEIIQSMAEKHPEWSIVMIGEIKGNKNFKTDELLTSVCRLKNVHFLGLKPYETLPMYQKGLDVLLLPYKINEFNQYVYPNKLHQYLAGGKPVVSSDLPEVRPFSNVIYIAKRREDFIEMVREALKAINNNGACIAERLHVARENSVQVRARQRISLLEEALNNKQGNRHNHEAE